jgi:hypothetical protein
VPEGSRPCRHLTEEKIVLSGQSEPDSRLHDLLGAFLGALATAILLSTPWQVDTSGPDPFYKGPLIYPFLVLSLMILASLPSVGRLLQPPREAQWHLDGAGFPWKTLIVLGFLVCFPAGLLNLGLTVSSVMFLMASLYLLGYRRPSTLIMVSFLVTGLIVLVFKYFLDVFFPEPLLLQWLAG